MSTDPAVTALAERVERMDEANESVEQSAVLQRFQAAGSVTDAALREVVAACVTGATTDVLCDMGNTFMEKGVKNIFRRAADDSNPGKRAARGIAYPCNVSVNGCVCNHAPRTGDAHVMTLRDGDVVKVHLGCHIDGYPCVAARTVVVGGTPRGDTEHRTVEASRVALAVLLRLLVPGSVNGDITDALARVASVMGVEPLEGVLSTQTKRWVLDSMAGAIILRRVVMHDPQQDVGECTIAPHDVWTLDVAFTNSKSYKTVPTDEPCGLFRRNEVPLQTDPRSDLCQALMKEIDARHFCFPFAADGTSLGKRARLGLNMMKRLSLVDELPPLACKGDACVTSRAAATVAVLPSRLCLLAGAPDVADVSTPLPPDVAALLTADLSFGVAKAKKRQRREASKQE